MKNKMEVDYLITKTSPIAVYFCKCPSMLVLKRKCPMPKPWILYYCELLVPAKRTVSIFILLKRIISHKTCCFIHFEDHREQNLDSPSSRCYVDLQETGAVPEVMSFQYCTVQQKKIRMEKVPQINVIYTPPQVPSPVTFAYHLHGKGRPLVAIINSPIY